MELRHLRHFVAAAEEELFGRAANRFQSVQPASSTQSPSLEEDLQAVGSSFPYPRKTRMNQQRWCAAADLFDQIRHALTEDEIDCDMSENYRV
ncbi:hypothetical protein SAMN05414139_03841 [Burkholderia sp. D7]|nr:hypothetical protein SAMN05414139_03841 [Burkholderia sp. D7]